MKYIKNLIAFMCLGTVVTSCNDFLVRDTPYDTTDDKWWVNQGQLENALKPIYLGLPSGVITYDRTYNHGSRTYANARVQLHGVTDDAVFRANYLDYESFTLGTANSSSPIPLQLYSMNYELIRDASRFLENYHRAYIPDPGLKERYAAEARALRAYMHMQLFMLYGPIPIVDKSVNPDEQYLSRRTQEEVVNFVISEFDAAAQVLPATYTDNEAWRFSKGACYACESELYLFIGDYAKAAQAAKKVIDLNVYELYHSKANPANSYAALFSYEAKQNKERVLYSLRGNRQAFRRLAPKSISGQVSISPTAELVNTYETKQGYTLQELGADSLKTYTEDPHHNDNRDPRLRASVLFPGETFLKKKFDPFTSTSPDLMGSWPSTYTGYWVKKWVTSTDQSKGTDSGDLDFFIIRYAEVLLNYVEALVESGDWNNPDVYTYLNAIRNRAGMPDVDRSRYNTQEKLRELVRRERRVELAFEGQRFFDIRRWKIGEQVMGTTVHGAVSPTTHQPIVVETRQFNPEKDYLWPIPINELNTNPNMTQNPGW